MPREKTVSVKYIRTPSNASLAICLWSLKRGSTAVVEGMKGLEIIEYLISCLRGGDAKAGNGLVENGLGKGKGGRRRG